MDETNGSECDELAGEGILEGCRYLLHDRDAKFCTAFGEILRSAGIEPLALPPRSPNLNAHLERWNRSVKEECLSKMILFREASLRHVLTLYVEHFHGEKSSSEGERDPVPRSGGPDRRVVR